MDHIISLFLYFLSAAILCCLSIYLNIHIKRDGVAKIFSWILIWFSLWLMVLLLGGFLIAIDKEY